MLQERGTPQAPPACSTVPPTVCHCFSSTHCPKHLPQGILLGTVCATEAVKYCLAQCVLLMTLGSPGAKNCPWPHLLLPLRPLLLRPLMLLLLLPLLLLLLLPLHPTPPAVILFSHSHPQYLLVNKFGFSPSQIVVLRDDDYSKGRDFIPYRWVL